jgi:predicted amidohydrolase YtcJ
MKGMERSLKTAAVLLGVLCASTGLHGEERGRVERVFYNGTIYTMDEERPVVGGIVTGDGRIIFAGSPEEAFSRAGDGAERIDLDGAFVVPGLTDAHAHFIGYAEGRHRVDLAGTRSLAEVRERISEYIRTGVPGGWVLGRGWDQNDWPEKKYPGREDLDEVSRDIPILIRRVCGHAAVANSRALELAGIDGRTVDPQGGRIVRDAEGRPTGLLFEEAVSIVREVIPPFTAEEKKAFLKEAARECLSVGLVGVHEMGVSTDEVILYRELYDGGELPFRVTAYLDAPEGDIPEMVRETLEMSVGGEFFDIVGVKFYVDGSLGARSAALLEDYTDDPGNRGMLVTEREELYSGILGCHEMGLQAAVHAIGDRGIRIMLDIYEQVLRESPRQDVRHRIEHAQVVNAADIGRFAELGVIPSMQFTHCTSDMPWAEDRLGPERVKGAYAWRSFLEAGCRVPGGSDFPVESIDPLLGLYAAVTRKNLAGEPPAGWYGGQCLTMEEAVRAFTVDAAYAAHLEGGRGSLSPGKLADFVVLSHDLMKIDPGLIPSVEVLMTVLGGEIVFRRER